MAIRHISLLILLIVSMFSAGCSNDAPASEPPQQSHDTTAVTPSPDPAPTTMESLADSLGKASQTPRENQSPESFARPNKKGDKPKGLYTPSTTVPAKKQNPAGNSTGYIGSNNIHLQSEPSANAPKIASLKINESVILLETKMTDEAGNTFPYSSMVQGAACQQEGRLGNWSFYDC
ncbi:MAG: hypothetical protein IPM82_04720 [Saprospiraceae bacterium]|nr:hypothetical protein [Saprospiraceae bacterium]